MLVVEGSIPNETINRDGYFTGFGRHPGTNQPITVNEWLDKLAPKATIVLAVGTCASYGGIHAMAGNPTGAMGVPDYLGWDWKSKTGIPIVCVPDCPAHPDNLSETILYLLYQVAGQAPMIPLDDHPRPRWLFGVTVHEGCNRAGYYEQGEFAKTYDSPKCLVKLGCGEPMPIRWRTGSPMAMSESESYGSVIRSLPSSPSNSSTSNPRGVRRAPSSSPAIPPTGVTTESGRRGYVHGAAEAGPAGPRKARSWATAPMAVTMAMRRATSRSIPRSAR